MRRINTLSQFVGISLMGLGVVLGGLLTRYLLSFTHFEFSINFISALLLSLFSFIFFIIIYRLFIYAFPLLDGEVPVGGKQDFIYGVHIGFHIMVFQPLTMSYFLPPPFRRLLFQALGSKLGAETYPAGILFDCQFIEVGSHATIGGFSMLVPHVMEDTRLAYYKIKLGDHVTVGMGSYVLAGTRIDDYGIVAANSVVLKNTHIQRGEIWAGTPAKKIGDRKDL